VPSRYFDGMVDEVRIWDAALNQAMISDENRHAHCTPLLAFWGFNGRSGNILEDSGPFEQDIDITGGVLGAAQRQYHEVSWAQQGVCGSALEFMNDELTPSCLETPAMPFTQKFTISMWCDSSSPYPHLILTSSSPHPHLILTSSSPNLGLS